MSAAAMTPPRWSARRWLGMILMVFALQLGLVFWLSDRAPAVRRVPAPGLSFRPAPASEAEFIALRNPTLFALPQPESFSGLAWLKRPALPVRFFEWSAPPAWLPLTAAQLDAAFARLLLQHQPAPPPAATRVAPDLTFPVADPIPPGPVTSQFRLSGDLSHRPLLTKPSLQAFPHTDLLSNSVVRMALGADGRPVSLAVIAKSGSADADQQAMQQSRALRFAPREPHPGSPAPNPLSSLDWGEITFEWATLPMNPTNLPTATALP